MTVRENEIGDFEKKEKEEADEGFRLPT